MSDERPQELPKAKKPSGQQFRKQRRERKQRELERQKERIARGELVERKPVAFPADPSFAHLYATEVLAQQLDEIQRADLPPEERWRWTMYTGAALSKLATKAELERKVMLLEQVTQKLQQELIEAREETKR